MKHTAIKNSPGSTGSILAADNKTIESAVKIVAQEEYVTGNEFRKLAAAKVKKFCDRHGIL